MPIIKDAAPGYLSRFAPKASQSSQKAKDTVQNYLTLRAYLFVRALHNE